MKPTYDQILEIMRRTMDEVATAGHDVRKCVWELSPSIRQTIKDHLAHAYPQTRAYKGGPDAFNGIPIRYGVTDEATGILLKMVHPKAQE